MRSLLLLILLLMPLFTSAASYTSMASSPQIAAAAHVLPDIHTHEMTVSISFEEYGYHAFIFKVWLDQRMVWECII